MTYDVVYIFTKKGNLLPYYEANVQRESERLRNCYAMERELKLIMLVRFEKTSGKARTMCRIKCPVNPLPIKGEFEVVSASLMVEFLTNQGWQWKDKIHRNLFEA
jgi:hypothetical protein